MSSSKLISIRSEYSKNRLEKLKNNLASIPEIEIFDNITIYTAGSFARFEASEYSDIDLFFLINGKPDDLKEANIDTIRMFAIIVEVVDHMDFPKFSNDGKYLKISFSKEMIDSLGGSDDDYLNHFTSRMLMLLESYPVYGNESYNSIIKEIVSSYFRDYPHHPDSFRPTFLVNDILRFWKTLCLNYEHKRNQPTEDQSQRIKQKVKNFKL
ncbi:MAG: hypothetical protein HOC91_06555 [Nitrospinaceae bacterium]|jgi:predicted nucleotidyltransferase|nr:hypothetical protein [Nitrospinaceae bacterium]MBT6716482.1 hypothetical protein [Nitrospina sp.]MBT3434193.1 hypothetical protein [Nitrospinaceae bacterium]MBT4093610.1 hypothetical protein [Nitrospinaceae bacterium]MBT4430156.1 hypothetical protein [Nitrospinaceae bacterium]